MLTLWPYFVTHLQAPVSLTHADWGAFQQAFIDTSLKASLYNIMPIALCILLLIFFINMLSLGYTKITLELYDHGRSSIGTLFSGSRYALRGMVASSLFYFICLIGLLFFILPLFYVTVAFGFYKLYLVDRNTGIIESLDKSHQLTSGVRWQLLTFHLILGLIAAIPSAIFPPAIFPPAHLLIRPILSLVRTYVYRKLQEQTVV